LNHCPVLRSSPPPSLGPIRILICFFFIGGIVIKKNIAGRRLQTRTRLYSLARISNGPRDRLRWAHRPTNPRTVFFRKFHSTGAIRPCGKSLFLQQGGRPWNLWPRLPETNTHPSVFADIPLLLFLFSRSGVLTYFCMIIDPNCFVPFCTRMVSLSPFC